MNDFSSWGRYPKERNQTAIQLSNRFEVLIHPTPSSKILPRGQGRSYGDCCLNNDGTLVSTANLNHFISFDTESGLMRCESGTTFDQILQTVVPHGWFLPVTPGTKFITVGGAIANDVHGKNHHKAGNFGRHVTQFEIRLSSGESRICSRHENIDLFKATIGGLGLTGLITWAEFNLEKINSSWIEQEQIQFNSVDDFFKLSQESEKDFEFTVSWVDCLHQGSDIRGLFMRGNFLTPPP